jgi:preprotein translocase subunit SecF
MEFFRIQRDIPFMRNALVFNIISLHLSIEFTGGTVIEVRYAQAAHVEQVRHVVEGMNFGEVQVQNFGTSRDVLIRLPLRGDVKQAEVVGRVFAELCKAESGTLGAPQATGKPGDEDRQACTTAAGAEPVHLQRSEFVGPQVGRELATDGAMALGFVIIGIMVYLAIRFEWKFAVAAILANLHDVIIILGFFAFFQWEFSLTVLAAVLAVLGYSVNESVVIFDRIREAFRKYRKMSTTEVIDHVITSTISRTIITHGSTQIMVLSMLLFGGPTLHHFALALTIGILFGIYSSVFVAAAIAMWLGVKREDLLSTSRKDHDPADPNAGAVV